MDSKKVNDLAPRRKPKQERARERLELILESTRTLVAEKGISAATTPNIAEHAGIPVSSIYQYFPNKKAIFVALYENYLRHIRDVVIDYEEESSPEVDWRDAFTRIFGSILQQEARDDLYRELEKAFTLYPELSDIDEEHSEFMADFLAGLMKQFGSRWTRARRLRLARFIYCVNGGVWLYRANWDGPDREVREWETTAVLALLEQAIEGK